MVYNSTDRTRPKQVKVAAEGWGDATGYGVLLGETELLRNWTEAVVTAPYREWPLYNGELYVT